MILNKSVLIKKTGFYLVNWDPEKNIPIEQTPISGDLAPYFSYFAEFDESVTIKEFLEVLGKFSEEINKIFIGYLNGVDIDLFIQETMILSTNQPALHYIELAWKVRMIDASDMLILDIIPNLIGVTEIPGTDSDVITELDFIKLRDICNFLISEQTAIDIPSPKTYQIEIEAERRWSLFDIISGFLGEIAKYGSPTEKSDMIDELNKEAKLSFSELLEYVDEVEQITNQIENSSPDNTLEDDEDDD